MLFYKNDESDILLHLVKYWVNNYVVDEFTIYPTLLLVVEFGSIRMTFHCSH